MTDLKTAMTVEVDGLQVRLIFCPLRVKRIPCMVAWSELFWKTVIPHIQRRLKTKGVRDWASGSVAYIVFLH